MLKSTILFSLLFTSYFCQAQFKVDNPEFLWNKEANLALLSPTLNESGYNRFQNFAEKKLKEITFKHPPIAQTFKVVEVIPYEKYGATHFKIKLQSAEYGSYYYDYNPKYNGKFVLDAVGELELPAK